MYIATLYFEFELISKQKCVCVCDVLNLVDCCI